MNGDTVTVMSDEQCWELLRGNELGRLGFHLLDEVHVVPINYTVDEDTLLFRTAEGSKLLGVVMHGDVVFEIDDHDEDAAWSVVVRGTARAARRGQRPPGGQPPAAAVGRQPEVQRRRDHPHRDHRPGVPAAPAVAAHGAGPED